MFRQCGIGYHEECSDRYGDECGCSCHTYVERLENVSMALYVLIHQGADASLISGAADELLKVLEGSPALGLIDGQDS